MSLIKDLLRFGTMEIWLIQSNFEDDVIGVALKGADVDEGLFLKGVFGTGKTIDDAVRDYVKQIAGQTIVINNEKFKVLLLEEDDK